MKKRPSESVQWKILTRLYSVYPRALTDSEFLQHFGHRTGEAFVASVRQLISDGLTEDDAVTTESGRAVVKISGLRLTRLGAELMKNALSVSDGS
ncbi:hypothetical protein I5P72_23195 [Serratia ureilytica]|uniref:hypothetical protein n=1 Tax=Serratia ureilytica TaxID=300181 RepID=UPI0018D9B395|nr:hypothetical protein [Serratia ureilytica]MBH3120274.1 hypothetical protein [Serratia ureilytica]